MAESQSALPLIEHLIKPLVYEVIFNPMTEKQSKLESLKCLEVISNKLPVFEILR